MSRTLVLWILALLASTCFLTAQDEPKPVTAPATAEAGAALDTEVLKLQLGPLQADQAKVEADAWIALLADENKAYNEQQIEARKGTAGAELRALEIETARTALLRNVEVVLKDFAAKGGDRKSYDSYISASTVTGPTSWFDPKAVWAYMSGWLLSPEGGIRILLNIIKFIATLLVFKFIAGIAGGIARKAISRMRSASALLRDFFINTVRKLTMFIGVIVALSMLEIDITPFVAALGAAGFIIGFALQGTLGNFAAGIMILIYRPYDIGQVVTVSGTTGKVDAMSLVSTTLRLPDNQTVVVPNGSIWGDVITNITGQDTRRVDMKFGCAYGDDLQKTQNLLIEIVTAHEKVLQDPAPVVKVHELGDSSVNFIVRPWAKTADYWDVYWDVTRAVKDRFDAEGLNIPFPQRDVHLYQAS
ncbi:MAG: mechanosensitive ion channel family protein [Planctomycetes bacterium]|nr:mechanosensitive ion channel family protein [Planctomycetota bacterium]